MSATAAILAEFEAQGILQPGESGWWRVWGANVRHVRSDDLVCFADDDESPAEWHHIDGTYVPKNHPLRWGFVEGDERYTLGALTPVMVVRRGTHNTLAES